MRCRRGPQSRSGLSQFVEDNDSNSYFMCTFSVQKSKSKLIHYSQPEPKPVQSKPQPAQSQKPEPNIQEVTDRMAAASTGGSGWGWGWSVDSLLSTATAGISTITSQVSQVINCH